jgi:hypothetical protein
MLAAKAAPGLMYPGTRVVPAFRPASRVHRYSCDPKRRSGAHASRVSGPISLLSF